MIEKICIRTSEIILSVLIPQTEIKEGCIYDPQVYYATIHRLTSGVLGIAASHNLHFSSKATPENVNDSFENLAVSLGGSCLFVENFKLLSDEELVAIKSFYDWFILQKPAQLHLSDLYELMLSLDFPIGNGTIIKGFDKQIENTIGSFYTPKELADKCVELTLDTYIFRNIGIDHFSESEKNIEQIEKVSALLSGSSFADHACGTGSFILATCRYIRRFLPKDVNVLLRKIALNFIAIEADPLALEIAKLQVLTAINEVELYPELSKNFIHGNPLLRPNGNKSSIIYNDSFYYHNGLAIEPAQLPICDVILGNPPWGTVGFDYDYFFHTLHPHLKETEGEDELIKTVDALEKSHPKMYNWFIKHETANDLAAEQIYEDERFRNSHMGGLNTNVLFTELTDSLCSKDGIVCLILKTATVSDPVNRKLLRHLKDRKRIMARYDLINTNSVFNIGEGERFSILILCGINCDGSHHFKETSNNPFMA